jgi:acetyl-CoA acyltransferase
MSDGAGASVLVGERVLKELGLEPLARWVGFAVGGVAPEVMGVGPIAAIPKVLKRTGVKQDEIEWIELNEAFAAQSLAVVKELDHARVSPGRDVALGHPLGATGAVRTQRSCTVCVAQANTVWSPCVWAPAWVPRGNIPTM